MFPFSRLRPADVNAFARYRLVREILAAAGRRPDPAVPDEVRRDDDERQWEHEQPLIAARRQLSLLLPFPVRSIDAAARAAADWYGRRGVPTSASRCPRDYYRCRAALRAGQVQSIASAAQALDRALARVSAIHAARK